VIANHLLKVRWKIFLFLCVSNDQDLEKRSVIVKKARRITLSAWFRGYLAGSAWKEYQQYGTVCGSPNCPAV